MSATTNTFQYPTNILPSTTSTTTLIIDPLQLTNSSSLLPTHSSLLLHFTSLELDLISSFKDDVTGSTESVAQATEQVTSYNYYDGNYTEQEIAVYEHEDEETKRVLREQIAANQLRVGELLDRLDAAERYLDTLENGRESGL